MQLTVQGSSKQLTVSESISSRYAHASQSSFLATLRFKKHAGTCLTTAQNATIYLILRNKLTLLANEEITTPDPAVLAGRLFGVGCYVNQEGEGLRAACLAGALVFVVAFWFDGGLFKLPTAALFWVLLELGANRGKVEVRMQNEEVKMLNC